MWRDFEGSVYWDELAKICGNISRAAGFQGAMRFWGNTVASVGALYCFVDNLTQCHAVDMRTRLNTYVARIVTQNVHNPLWTTTFHINVCTYVFSTLWSFLSTGEGNSSSTAFQTLCGTPNKVENLNVNSSSLNVTWEPPTQLNGHPSSTQYVVRYF